MVRRRQQQQPECSTAPFIARLFVEALVLAEAAVLAVIAVCGVLRPGFLVSNADYVSSPVPGVPDTLLRAGASALFALGYMALAGLGSAPATRRAREALALIVVLLFMSAHAFSRFGIIGDGPVTPAELAQQPLVLAITLAALALGAVALCGVFSGLRREDHPARMPSRLSRFPAGLLAGGATLLVGTGVLAGISVGFFKGAQDRPVLEFIALLATLSLVWLTTARTLRGPANERADPGAFRVGLGRDMAVIFGFGVLLRAALIPAIPVLEDDYFRYLWEGQVTARGISPYAFSPREVDDFARRADRRAWWEPVARGERPAEDVDLLRLETEFSNSIAPPAPLKTKPDARLSRLNDLRVSTFGLWRIHGFINHADTRSVYPPASQWMFALAAAAPRFTATLAPWPSVPQPLRERADGPPGPGIGAYVTPFKIVISLLDLLAGVFLAGALFRLGRDPRWAILYLWCPLVLKEFALTAHLDALAVAAVAGALFFAAGRQHGRAGAALAVGVLAKLYPLILIPLFLRTAGRRGFLPMAGGALVAAAVIVGPMELLDPPLSQVARETLAQWSNADKNANADDTGKDNAAREHSREGFRRFFREWDKNGFLYNAVAVGTQHFTDTWWGTGRRDAADANTNADENSVLGWLTRENPRVLARYMVALAALGFAFFLALRRRRPRENPGIRLAGNCAAVLGAVFLLSPAAFAWYALWPLSLLPLVPRRWMLVLAVTISGYYGWFVLGYGDVAVITLRGAPVAVLADRPDGAVWGVTARDAKYAEDRLEALERKIPAEFPYRRRVIETFTPAVRAGRSGRDLYALDFFWWVRLLEFGPVLAVLAFGWAARRLGPGD